MRIEALRALIAVVWLTALLWPKFTLADNVTLSSLGLPLHRPEYDNWIPLQKEYNRDMYIMLETEGGVNGSAVKCCPTVEYYTAPKGGSSRNKTYVELYRDEEYNQTFFEVSCHPDVVDKPCGFIDRKLHPHSICVQEYSYSYALIKPQPEGENGQEQHHKHRHNHHTPWTLDHIKVRSGCSCKVTPPKNKKKYLKGKKNKGKTRKPNE